MLDMIIDTDIGIDCDDAMAIAAALALEKKKIVRLAGISTCTTRRGACGAAKAILHAYGAEKEVSVCKGTPLECDKINVYAEALKDGYAEEDCGEESVRFLRRMLEAAERPVTLVGIGPLTVLARLLDSAPDDLSGKDGETLIREKVSRLYAMAGNFAHLHGCHGKDIGHLPEWNVQQDIPAAKAVAERFPVPVMFLPYETGAEVLSGEVFDGEGPVGKAIRLFYAYHEGDGRKNFSRPSWDVLTVCAAGGLDLFESSPAGKVLVDDDGMTDFIVGEGNMRYLTVKKSDDETARILNRLYRTLNRGTAVIEKKCGRTGAGSRL